MDREHQINVATRAALVIMLFSAVSASCGSRVQNRDDIVGTYAFAYNTEGGCDYRLMLNCGGTYEEVLNCQKGFYYNRSAKYRNTGKWHFYQTRQGSKVYLLRAMVLPEWLGGGLSASPPPNPYNLTTWEFDAAKNSNGRIYLEHIYREGRWSDALVLHLVKTGPVTK